jgi:predicted  nucleic acid-binding Zn-ribbon protein
LHPHLKLLIELQSIDSEFEKLVERKKMLEMRMEMIRQKPEEYKRRLQEIKDEFAMLQAEVRRKELQLKLDEQALKELQGKVYKVRSNEEYTALMKEIEAMKMANSKKEDEILAMLDRMEEMKEELNRMDEELDTMEGLIKKEMDDIESEAEELISKVDEIAEKRKEITSKLPQDLLFQYERILKNRGGLAVVPIKDGVCQGCFMTLPPQFVVVVSRNDEINFCSHCARIIYAP